MMFNKKKKAVYGSVLSNEYVPAYLPRYGLGLDTFITSDYRLLSRSFIQEQYDAAEAKLSELVQTSDRFSVGSSCDAYIEGQIPHLEAIHREDVAAHELQIHNIRSGLEVRKGVVERRMKQLEQSRAALAQKIEPLKDLKAQFEITVGRFLIPIGLPVTLASMAVDALLNYSYLNTILMQNVFLLAITVACLSVMSDGSMYALGMLMSRKNEEFMDKRLYTVSVIGLLTMFLLSVISGVMIRFGSMDVTYGTINAAGEFVGKDSYSLAEWGISLVTAFLTTTTGLISLVFSIDKNAHLVDRRREMEAELAALDAEYESLSAERDAIVHAADPAIRDLDCRKAAEKNLKALPVGLKQHMRKLLAAHQGEASYTDAMAESAAALLPQPSEEKRAPSTDNNLSIHMNNDLKEAV